MEAKDNTNEKLIKELSQRMPAGRGESILLVEDEEEILEITKKILEKHGYKVITAIDEKRLLHRIFNIKKKSKLFLLM